MKENGYIWYCTLHTACTISAVFNNVHDMKNPQYVFAQCYFNIIDISLDIAFIFSVFISVYFVLAKNLN